LDLHVGVSTYRLSPAPVLISRLEPWEICMDIDCHTGIAAWAFPSDLSKREERGEENASGCPSTFWLYVLDPILAWWAPEPSGPRTLPRPPEQSRGCTCSSAASGKSEHLPLFFIPANAKRAYQQSFAVVEPRPSSIFIPDSSLGSQKAHRQAPVDR
jgi:hypothetical protein